MPSTATAGMTSFISFACSSVTTGPATNTGKPLFQAFSPIPAWESTDGDCIKVGVKIDPCYNTGHDFVYPDSFIMNNEDYNEGTGYLRTTGLSLGKCEYSGAPKAPVR